MNAMKQIKRTQAYQTTDGCFFENKKECVEHQQGINIEEGVAKIAMRAQTELGIDPWKMSLFLLKNGDDIKTALGGGFIADEADLMLPVPEQALSDEADLVPDVTLDDLSVAGVEQSVVTELQAA